MPQRRLFVPGDSTHAYPLDAWGYEEVGTVVEVGEGVDSALVGSLVWGTWGHRSSVVRPAEWVHERLMPDGLDPVAGIFAKIGAIGLNAVLDADIHVGETVVVFGAGVPGQIVAQLARLNGARVICVDLMPARRELAERLGAAAHARPSGRRRRGAGPRTHRQPRSRRRDRDERQLSRAARGGPHRRVQLSRRRRRVLPGRRDTRFAWAKSSTTTASPSSAPRSPVSRRHCSTAGTNSACRRRPSSSPATADSTSTSLITHTLPAEDAPAAFEMLDTSPEAALQVVLDYRPAS